MAEKELLAPSSSLLSAKESPHMMLYNKMEKLVKKMRSPDEGVPIKTVKSLLTKIPDVFSGEDLVRWLEHHMNIDVEEAIHLGSLIAAHGYFFPIDDHVITLKNDNSFYRFQSEHFWPSKGWDPDNTEYAVYLCKRTMQNKARLELADYEADNLAKLQNVFANNWEDIFAQAEVEAKNDKKRDKIDRKVHDSQERAFWDVHRPVPGCVNTFEVDIKKAYSYTRDKTKKSLYQSSPRKGNERSVAQVTPKKHESVESLKASIEKLCRQMDRHCLKMSKVCETINFYTEQHAEYDPMITLVEPSNPWMSGDEQYWTDSKSKEITVRRATKWKFSFNDLLKDEIGRKEFKKFLQKEFSAENLDFYLASKKLKKEPFSNVKGNVEVIFQNFLSEETPNPINIDSKIKDITVKNMEKPNRYCFEQAQEHIYQLMKTDSYARFLKSDQYKTYLSSQEKTISRFKNTSSGHNEYSSD